MQSVTVHIHQTTQKQYAFYKNAQGVVPFNSGIHPGKRSKETKNRKRQNINANHQARRLANQLRNQNKNNPNWHGIGRHAGVKAGH